LLFVLALGASLFLPAAVAQPPVLHRAAQFASNEANKAFLTLGILGLLFLAVRGASLADGLRVARVMLGETIAVHALKVASNPC
jgi:hypothetical protein